MTIGRYFKFCKSFDRSVFKKLSGNKLSEYTLFNNYIKREWIYVDVNTKAEEINSFIRKHSEVIAKPNNGEQGHGIFCIKGIEDSRLLNLINRGPSISYILEERIYNHPEINKINASSLNTLRVYTYRNSEEVKILAAMLRVGRPGVEVDNWGSGGIGYHIDVKTGICDSYGLDKKGNQYMFHPTSNVQMIGFKIPNWNDLLVYIDELCNVEKNATFVGWDIALSTNGCDLIEMNFPGGHDFLQVFGKPIWDQIKYDL